MSVNIFVFLYRKDIWGKSTITLNKWRVNGKLKNQSLVVLTYFLAKIVILTLTVYKEVSEE